MKSLGEAALRLARHLVHISEDGLSSPINWSVVLDRYSGTDPSEVAEAAFELQQSNYVKISGGVGAADGIVRIRPDYSLFWRFDKEEFSFDSLADAAELARLMLDENTLQTSSNLHAHVGWPKRRFNPALAKLGTCVASERTRNTLEPNYVTTGFSLAAEDRTLLKAMITEAGETAKNQEAFAITEKFVPAKFKLPLVEIDIPLPKWAAYSILGIGGLLVLILSTPSLLELLPEMGFESRTTKLMSPENGTEFSRIPRTLELSWAPVTGASRYIVSIQAQDIETGDWFEHPGRSRISTVDTTATFDFIGSQPGRWTVMAIDENGTESRTASWWSFFFTDDFPSCRHEQHGVEGWSRREPITEDSGWIGGGSSPSKWCGSRLEALRDLHDPARLALVGSSEDHKTEYQPFKADYYRYTCNFTIEDPVFALEASEHCLIE